MEKVIRVSKPLGGLRTKLWFAKVAHGRTPAWFWKTIDRSIGDRATWERYKRGLRDAVPHAGRDRVALFDAQYPGSAIYHRTAMWNVLDGKTLNINEITGQIAKLGDPTRTIVLAGGYRSGVGDRDFDRVLSELEQFPDFETLACIVLMLAWSENLHNLKLWNDLCQFYRHMIPAFIARDEIPFHGEVFDMIDAYARTRILAKLNVRDDHFEDWRDQLLRLQEMLDEEQELHRNYHAAVPKTFVG